MPLYDFTCLACDRTFEALVRGADAPVCPSCGGRELRQHVSTFAVSSAATRHTSLQKVRQTNLRVEKDKAVAEQERIERFEREHH